MVSEPEETKNVKNEEEELLIAEYFQNRENLAILDEKLERLHEQYKKLRGQGEHAAR